MEEADDGVSEASERAEFWNIAGVDGRSVVVVRAERSLLSLLGIKTLAVGNRAPSLAVRDRAPDCARCAGDLSPFCEARFPVPSAGISTSGGSGTTRPKCLSNDAALSRSGEWVVTTLGCRSSYGSHGRNTGGCATGAKGEVCCWSALGALPHRAGIHCYAVAISILLFGAILDSAMLRVGPELWQKLRAMCGSGAR